MLRDMPTRKPSPSITCVLNPAIVMSRTGLDQPSIVAGVAAGTFPTPIRLGDRVVWKQDDVSEWVRARIAAGDEAVIALQRLSPAMERAMERLIDALADEFVKEELAAAKKVPPEVKL
jgi:predicted DNA-binding transcriptional regulator AlpA